MCSTNYPEQPVLPCLLYRWLVVAELKQVNKRSAMVHNNWTMLREWMSLCEHAAPAANIGISSLQRSLSDCVYLSAALWSRQLFYDRCYSPHTSVAQITDKQTSPGDIKIAPGLVRARNRCLQRQAGAARQRLLQLYNGTGWLWLLPETRTVGSYVSGQSENRITTPLTFPRIIAQPHLTFYWSVNCRRCCLHLAYWGTIPRRYSLILPGASLWNARRSCNNCHKWYWPVKVSTVCFCQLTSLN